MNPFFLGLSSSFFFSGSGFLASVVAFCGVGSAVSVSEAAAGGGVGPSQEIFREVRKTIQSKSVIASMGSVAASGGFYIAAGTKGIVANPGTITGSIGVIMGYTNFKEIMSKIGLVPVVVKSGPYKDLGSPVRDMTEEEREILQGFVDQIHQQFVRDVSEGRDMDLEKIKTLANGQIYTGEAAKSLGLIDRIGNLEDAIEWAGRMGGIEGEIEAVYPKEKPLSLLKYLTGETLDEIFGRISASKLFAGYLYQPGH